MEFLNAIMPQLESMGYLLYILVFLIAAVESIVFLGIVIPGTLLIIFMGFLAAQTDLSIVYLSLSTSLGASLGDYISFYLGSKKGEWIKKLIPRFTRTDYVQIGGDFFKQHGDKSVFIGRFIAIIRPFIPFIAGICKMNARKFLFWNILSALVWSVLYILIGYFFGYAWKSAAVWASRISFIILLLAVIALSSYFGRIKFSQNK